MRWSPQQRDEILRALVEEGAWDTQVELGTRSVTATVWSLEEPNTPEQLGRVEQLLGKLSQLDKEARHAIRALHDDPAEGQWVQAYRSHHLEELDGDALSSIFGTPDAAEISVDAFFAKLEFKNVSFHPEDEEQFAVLDYTIGTEVTDYVLAVVFDDQGRIVDIDMES